MSTQPTLNKYKSWASYEDSDNDEDEHNRSRSNSPNHPHEHHHHTHHKHSNNKDYTKHFTSEGDTAKKEANRNEIIGELQASPPSYPISLIIYNVPYDCDEEEMSTFLNGYNVKRTKQLKEGMYKIDFDRCENAIIFVKAEINMMKGRDLIFRINQREERPKPSYNNKRNYDNKYENSGGYKPKDRDGYKKNNYNGNTNNRDYNSNSYKPKNYGGDDYDRLINEDRDDYEGKRGYKPKRENQGYKKQNYERNDNFNKKSEDLDRNKFAAKPRYDEYQSRNEEEEVKTLNFRASEPKFVNKNPPKIITRPMLEKIEQEKAQAEKERLNQESQKEKNVKKDNDLNEKFKGFNKEKRTNSENQDSAQKVSRFQSHNKATFVPKERCYTEQEKESFSIRKDSGVQTEEKVKSYTQDQSKPYYKDKDLKGKKPKKKFDEWVPKGESEDHKANHGKISTESKEFYLKNQKNYKGGDQKQREYQPKPGFRPKSKTEYEEKREVYVPKEEPVVDKKSSPKSKKKNSANFSKKESKNTSNVFDVLMPK